MIPAPPLQIAGRIVRVMVPRPSDMSHSWISLSIPPDSSFAPPSAKIIDRTGAEWPPVSSDTNGRSKSRIRP